MFYPPLYSSPTERLPVELLSYVFHLGTHGSASAAEVDHDDDDVDTGRNPRFTTDSIRTPLLLSRVCRRWRNVARSTPSLWTSLCITVEMVEGPVTDDSDDGSPYLRKPASINTSHLATYLALSRNYPLDILIDARDQNWDFTESETSSEYEPDAYTPPFSSTHMNTVISLLLPHLSRWRSIDILTDVWAPMYVALQRMQPCIVAYGAPMLESLTLMRCNDFVSYSPTFQPIELKDPSFLSLSEHQLSQHPGDFPRPCDLLPRLRTVTLRGVHAHWSSLASILSASQLGLRTLELSSHCPDVRPTLEEFHRILASVPGLRKLVINGSGPFITEDMVEEESVLHQGLSRVSLPELQQLSIGYRSSQEGQIILELLHAPNVRSLVLEDSAHPGEPQDIDAGSMLTYMGTGDLNDSEQDFDLVQAMLLQDDWRMVDTYDVGGLTETMITSPSLPDFVFLEKKPTAIGPCTTRATFPLVEKVVLKGVKSLHAPLQTFFSSLTCLKKLELNGMSMQAIRALLPCSESSSSSSSSYASPPTSPTHISPSPTYTSTFSPTSPSSAPTRGLSPCPCPLLRSLCIRGFDRLRNQDFEFIVENLAMVRLSQGACGLKEVDIHVEDVYAGGGGADGVEDMITMSCGSLGTTVNIFWESAYRAVDEDDEDEEMLSDDMTYDGPSPYEAGGVFNDPIFDAYFAERTISAR